MSTHEIRPELSSEVGDQNVERLLGEVYRPEVPDAEFARRLTANLCATAQELAQSRTRVAAPAEVRLRRTRRSLACLMGAAATLAACALLTHALQKPAVNPEKSQATTRLPRRERAPTEEPHVAENRARQQTPAPVAIGETLSTKQGERRRVALPDGSILYLNEKTTVQ